MADRPCIKNYTAGDEISSSAGHQAQGRLNPKKPRPDFFRRGLTLTEIAIALVILGMIIAAVVTLYSRLSPRLQIIAARHDVLTSLNHAHSEAVSSKKEVTVAFFPVEDAYVMDELQHKLRVSFGVILDNNPPEEIQNAFVFHFHPDGTATSGTVSLFRDDYQENIHVDPATGQAKRVDQR